MSSDVVITLIFFSILSGVFLTLLIQWILFKKWFQSLPISIPPWTSQFDKYELPKELKDAISDPELKTKKESCINVNLIFQFLFQELKDTNAIRRWVMTRMNMEFAEMLQTTTGKLLDQISVRDFSLGGTFPIIKSATVKDVQLQAENTIQDLSIDLDLTYSGGFQLAVDVDMVFGKSAYLCVKVTKLQGVAQLQFTRIPYTHWSFSFVEDPVIEFQVDSHFEGRTIPQITSLIINQIRRSVRKKHTLPNYKIRYRPFFIKPEPKPPSRDIYYHGNKLSVGHLQVTVLECNRLVKLTQEGFIYCTLAIDSLPWVELMTSRKKLWVAHDIEIIRGQAQNIGITFKEEFVLDKYEELVVVDYVSPNSPAHKADLRKNDLVIAVGGNKVTSSKQVAKLMKQAGERIVVRIERSATLKGMAPSASEIKFEEDTVSIKDGELSECLPAASGKDEPCEDYINITVSEGSLAEAGSKTDSREKLAEDKPASPSAARKSFLGSTGLFHRRKNKAGEGKSPRDSPEMGTKVEHATSQEDVGLGGPLADEPLHQKKRSKSDVGLVTKESQQPSAKPDTISLHSQSTDGSSSSSTAPTDPASEGDGFDLKKTKFVKSSQDPVFCEKFEFDIDDNHNFLNVCVWCKIREKLDKQQRVIKPEKDVLLGHISIPLMDVALECLATLQGDVQNTYKLTPAELKAGAIRTKFSNLSAHPGFEERLCYGDIVLSFLHDTRGLSTTERRRIEKIKAEHESTDCRKSDESHVSTDRKPVPEGKHDFVSTHFQSATYCNFCLKKIWLKTAFRCKVCDMVCHKKCIEKCQAQTQCSRDNKQNFRPPDAPATPPRGHKNGKDGTAAKGASAASSKPGFLSKFRKDNNRGGSSKGADSPKITRRSPSPERKRHCSAPDDSSGGGSVSDGEGASASSAAEKLLAVNAVPRTRSSTSLQDLIKENAAPTIQQDEMEDSSPESSDTDDDEMNLMRFYEKQKAHNHADEVVVTAAKEMGKELYAHMTPEERREKLDNMVSKLQLEIDQESEHRGELSRMEHEATDSSQRASIRSKVENSDEKIQSLALLMLHYCAGLQHCLDQQETERSASAELSPDRAEGDGHGSGQPPVARAKRLEEEGAGDCSRSGSPRRAAKSKRSSVNGGSDISGSSGSIDSAGRGGKNGRQAAAAPSDPVAAGSSEAVEALKMEEKESAGQGSQC